MPEPDSPEDFETHRRAAAPVPGPEEARPDWLVGAEEGTLGERPKAERPTPPLKLVRPAGDAAPAPGGDKKPSPPKAWKAAASSVPRLQRVEGTAPTPPNATPAARPAEPAWAEPGFDRASGSKESHERDDFLGADLDNAAPGADEMDPLAVVGRPAAPAATRAALKEPWWAVVVDALQTNRVLQLGILAAILAALAWFMWPRSEPTVAIHSIHEHPERFDGMTVRVSGKVGDVYDVGGAYAYYLEQGRDTIVVFSRSRRPYRNEKLHVSGSVSMGYLDGVARPSLFEVAD